MHTNREIRYGTNTTGHVVLCMKSTAEEAFYQIGETEQHLGDSPENVNFQVKKYWKTMLLFSDIFIYHVEDR